MVIFNPISLFIHIYFFDIVLWFTGDFLKGKCDAATKPDNDHCCSSSNLCGEGEGDCDYDSHCAGNLICEQDNCQKFDSRWSSQQDCCQKGKTNHFFICLSN